MNHLRRVAPALAAARAVMARVHRSPAHGCSLLAKMISARAVGAANRIRFGNGSGEILVALAVLSISKGDVAALN